MTDKPKYDMSGILFFQDDKDADNKPDWKGNITVRGEELDLAGWIKQGKRGNFLTLKVSEKRRQDVSGTVPATSPSPARTKTPTTQQARRSAYPQDNLSYEDGKEQDLNSGMDGWDEDNAPPF
jgi:hypothetical protein